MILSMPLNPPMFFSRVFWGPLPPPSPQACALTHATKHSHLNRERRSAFIHTNTMGEPVIGSIVCGSVALVMMIWNWRMVEHQKWLLRKCGKEAATKARARAQLRAEARAQVAAPFANIEEEACISADAPSKSSACPSSRYVAKLESLPEWNESESSPDMDMFCKTRDRIETAPMSPASSSTRSRSGTGCFFSDG